MSSGSVRWCFMLAVASQAANFSRVLVLGCYLDFEFL